MIYDGRDMYLAADGVKIAKRCKGNTWISLEPGWRVMDKSDSITIEYTAPSCKHWQQGSPFRSVPCIPAHGWLTVSRSPRR